ncbi:ATP-binding cassette domain-containing protein [Streptomyces sp. NBC_00539]|uniref:ATP-binding cassette domain-containing protein n=1 Tax=Streptomyces sp. NBC_00539 TaxID=2975770 RepID=UPI002E7FF7D6|nr:ATP-binding cassette domain-containing protein [Streptomyces sp. NBC_00539]WUC64271.1 ATP-binding cassette domain-containing protein [Streptomyces sp. NBC_00539]
MLQAIGLTSTPRRDLPPAVDDLTFEARPGCVTALLGEPGSGKTTALRLMLELEPGRGVTYFRGRPLHQVPQPGREVGVLLGDVPGNPSRTVRNQLRMLCAAAGVPAARADTMLEVVGIAGLRDHRLGSLSRAMERRFALAAALLADPCTLLLDEPAADLSPRERSWLYGLLRRHASLGGAVLFTTDDAKEAARGADRVVSIEAGRLVADQDAADFARTRLRPRVAVRTPHAARLADVLGREARAAQRAVEIVAESGTRLSVYGSNCAEVGEAAFRNGVLVHQLADETGDAGDAGDAGTPTRPVPQARTEARATDARAEVRIDACAETRGETGHQAGSQVTPDVHAVSGFPGGPGLPAESWAGSWSATGPAQDGGDAHAALPDVPAALERTRGADLVVSAVRRVGGPLRPLRYELLRVFGTATPWLTAAVVIAASVITAVLLARTGAAPRDRMLAAWPELLPLPPAALGAGLLGALAFGEEYRYPALAAARGTVPRRLGLLTAKLGVCSALALLIGALALLADACAVQLVFGAAPLRSPAQWIIPAVSWAGLLTGCAWAGVLASAVFRSTAAGLAAVLAVPVAVVPLVRKVLAGPSAYPADGIVPRLRGMSAAHWPPEADRLVLGVLRMMAQPVGTALVLSLIVLLCAYGFTGLRGRVRW